MPDDTMSTETAQPKATPPAPVTATTQTTAQAKPGHGKGHKRGPEIRIPQQAFKSRVEREAAAIVKKRLGISLEEAEQIVKAGGVPAQTTSTPAGVTAVANTTANDAIAKMQAENEKLRRQVATANKTAQDWQNKHKKDTSRLRDRQIETELKSEALRAGVVDPDYAVTLFARAAAKGEASDPAVFFGTLKTSHGHLFNGATAPAPVTVSPTTAPPESLQPGENKPSPTPAGTPATVANVEAMSPQDFNRHLRSYGYQPGM